MRKMLMSAVLATFAAGLLTNSAAAHSVFMKALKSKYEFKTVSCSTCHSKKDEIAEADMAKFEEEPKHFRNDFGQLFMPHIKGKNVDDRAEKAAELKKAARDAETEAEEEKLKAEAEEIEEALAKDFLEALEKVEAQKSGDKTYAELLKAGEVDGVRLPE